METQYTAQLKVLVKDYYNRNISFDVYREQRKTIIDKMEREFNGGVSVPEEDEKPATPS